MSGLLTQKVSYIFGVKKHPKPYQDAFGVEIEVEPARGVRPNEILPVGELNNYWRTTSDGSLRNGGYEIISKVMNEHEIDNAKSLYNQSFPWQLFCTTSPRTSTHVHINFSQNYLYEVITFFCHMLLIEDIIAEYSGKSRKGNLFALEAGKSLSNYNNVRELVAKQDYKFLNNDYKYAAINLESLQRIGTVEVRTMRGLTDIDDIFEWVQILVEIKRMCTNKTPRDIDFNNLLPKKLMEFCVEQGIDYQEKINSQLSLFYDIMSSHPTQWDFSNPKCDWRNSEGLQEFNQTYWGVKDVNILLSYDYYRKFLANRKVEPEPFRPNQPLPPAQPVAEEGPLGRPDNFRAALLNRARENRFAEIDWFDNNLVVPQPQGLVIRNAVVEEMPDDLEPDVELDDFDEDEVEQEDARRF